MLLIVDGWEITLGSAMRRMQLAVSCQPMSGKPDYGSKKFSQIFFDRAYMKSNFQKEKDVL
jgi:hypothetical protein